jgi:hypothetical protein
MIYVHICLCEHACFCGSVDINAVSSFLDIQSMLAICLKFGTSESSILSVAPDDYKKHYKLSIFSGIFVCKCLIVATDTVSSLSCFHIELIQG